MSRVVHLRVIAMLLVAFPLVLPGLAHAAFPGKNGKIAYVHAGDVWTVNPDGTGAAQLTSGPAQEATPSWSPDGSQIAFISTRTDPEPGTCSFGLCVKTIDVMDADGGNVRAVVPGVLFNSPLTPVWSPDGARIAFARRGSLWTVAADGSDERELPSVYPGGCGARHRGVAAWSPDGTRLITDSSAGCREEAASCVVTVATGDASCVFTTSDEFYEDWSPDSGSILIGSDGIFLGLHYFRDGNLVEVTPPRQGADGYAGNAAWSPDGTTIVFGRDEYLLDGTNDQVYLVDAGGGNLRPLGGPHVGCCYDWQPLPAPRPQDYKNRAKFCRAEQEFWGEQGFADRYGSGANAYGRCVSGRPAA